MRRLIFGAMALVTGVAAAIGLAVRRRRGHRDESLPLEPAPPLLATPGVAPAEAGAAPVASMEADLGAAAGLSVAPRRRRPRPKPAGAKASEGNAADVSGRPADTETAVEIEPGPVAEASTEPTMAPKRRRRPRHKPATPAASRSPNAPATLDAPDPPEPADSPGAS
jgi:hypothetical protein